MFVSLVFFLALKMSAVFSAEMSVIIHGVTFETPTVFTVNQFDMWNVRPDLRTIRMCLQWLL
jgi:hypothetical protein